MPAIKRRISASSSTIRMSCAIDLAEPRSGQGPDVGCRRRSPGDENELHRGATAGTVAKNKIAAMVFHDLLDDGETEASAFGASGDIGLRQPVALGPRQASPVVFHQDRHLAWRAIDGKPDLARWLAHPVADAALNGVGRVLQQIVQR